MVLGSGVVFLDSTAVNVALPSIGRTFGVGLADLQWTITAYTLTLSAFLLLGGALGDRFGRRRVFLIGLIWFTVASMVCGVAPSPQLLIAARAAQGIGGALLTPGSLAIIEASFRPDERGRAIGAWSGFGGVFGAIGPLLGGLLVQSVSWRLVFFINVPIAAFTVWVVVRHVPESRQPGDLGPLDLRGPILAALGFGGVIYALIEGPSRGWTTAPIVASLAAGIVFLGAFFLNETRHPAPVLPLSLFRTRQFVGANGATFVIYAALGAVTFLLVLQLQDALHYSPLEAGVALMPLTLILLALSSTSGKLSDRIGPRIPMTVGPLIAATGMALFVRVLPGASYLSGVLPGRPGLWPGHGAHGAGADHHRAGLGRAGAGRGGIGRQQRCGAHRFTDCRGRGPHRGGAARHAFGSLRTPQFGRLSSSDADQCGHVRARRSGLLFHHTVDPPRRCPRGRPVLMLADRPTAGRAGQDPPMPDVT